MKNAVRLAAAVLLAILVGSGSAQAGFIGATIRATASFPTLVAPSTTAGPLDRVVGPGAEFLDGQFTPFFGPTFDFDDTTITITHAQTGHSPGSFNGYTFFDVFFAIDPIVNVSILSDNTGFFSSQPARVFFDADNVFVNFASLSFAGTQDPTIVLQVDFASDAIPEPATLTLLGLGLAGLRFVRRRPAA